jgi:hypothetical protein
MRETRTGITQFNEYLEAGLPAEQDLDADRWRREIRPRRCGSSPHRPDGLCGHAPSWRRSSPNSIPTISSRNSWARSIASRGASGRGCSRAPSRCDTAGGTMG